MGQARTVCCGSFFYSLHLGSHEPTVLILTEVGRRLSVGEPCLRGSLELLGSDYFQRLLTVNACLGCHPRGLENIASSPFLPHPEKDATLVTPLPTSLPAGPRVAYSKKQGFYRDIMFFFSSFFMFFFFIFLFF